MSSISYLPIPKTVDCIGKASNSCSSSWSMTITWPQVWPEKVKQILNCGRRWCQMHFKLIQNHKKINSSRWGTSGNCPLACHVSVFSFPYWWPNKMKLIRHIGRLKHPEAIFSDHSHNTIFHSTSFKKYY